MNQDTKHILEAIRISGVKGILDGNILNYPDLYIPPLLRFVAEIKRIEEHGQGKN